MKNASARCWHGGTAWPKSAAGRICPQRAPFTNGWQRAGSFRSDTHAREQQADLYADEIIKIADDCTPTHEEIAKARVRIDARKWKAARLAPKKYGEKSELDMKSSDGSMTPKAGQVQMSKEDFQGALSEALKEITR